MFCAPSTSPASRSFNSRAPCCCCCETQTRTLSGPPSTGASIAMDGGVADTPCYYTGTLLLLLFNTTRARTHSRPPSTGATITMDGGVADTLLLLFNTTRTTSGPPSTRGSVLLLLFNTTRMVLLLLLFNTTRTTSGAPCCCCSTQRAQPPDPQAREPLSLWTEAWPTHNLLLHRPLVGGDSRGEAQPPPLE